MMMIICVFSVSLSLSHHYPSHLKTRMACKGEREESSIKNDQRALEAFDREVSSFQALTQSPLRERNKQIEIHLFLLSLSASCFQRHRRQRRASSLGVLKPVAEDMRCIIQTSVETISSAVRGRENEALRYADSISKNNIVMFVQLEKARKKEKLSQMSKNRLLIYHRWKRLIIKRTAYTHTHTLTARQLTGDRSKRSSRHQFHFLDNRSYFPRLLFLRQIFFSMQISQLVMFQ